jgi:hypothetical protein
MKQFVITTNENYKTIRDFAKTVYVNATVTPTATGGKFNVFPEAVAREVAEEFNAALEIFEYDAKKLWG